MLVACQRATPATSTKSITKQAQLTSQQLTISAPAPVTDQAHLQVQQALAKFVTSKLQSKAGFYTNYLATTGNDELASGHELLSESAGLYLRHLAVNGSPAAFKQFYQQTKTTFGQKNQFSYRVKAGQQSPVNATVDDLRILRSLYEYQARHHDTFYQSEIDRLVKGLRQGAVRSGQLVDYYDPQLKKAATTGTLCYFDFKTLGQFEDITTLQQQLEIVHAGYLGNKFPFYRTRYHYDTKKYSGTKEINTTESLLTILHLSEVGQARKESLDYLTKRVAAADLANRYDRQGRVLDSNQASANYGLCYLIGVSSHRSALQQAAFKQLKHQQIVAPASPLVGGYGDPQTLATYSFNNLVVLLALDY